MDSSAFSGLADPVQRAEKLARSLSRQRRFEEARQILKARDDLLSLRRSYHTLLEAASVRFAALWPAAREDGTAVVRVNIVWDGRLKEAVSLSTADLPHGLEKRLNGLREKDTSVPEACRQGPMAVRQKHLDGLLAVRRWFLEGGHARLVVLPSRQAAPEEWTESTRRLLTEATRALTGEPDGCPAGAVH
jgi:hypothetical protein